MTPRAGVGLAEKCPITGKRRLDRRQAHAEARWWRRSWMARMNAYWCRSCSSWHVGNNVRKPRRVRR